MDDFEKYFGNNQTLKDLKAVYEIQELSKDECFICAKMFSNLSSRVLKCGHKFHTQCLTQWENKQRTCPLCRAPF